MISIILPIYNMQDYVAECLESVINQTYKDIEIICVNDFSMDNSMTIVKTYAERDNRIKIVNNDRNRGLGGARNAGLDIAKGEYIMFCDTDDKVEPDFVEELYININKYNSDMAFCDVKLLNSDGSITWCKPFHDMNICNYETFSPKENFEHFTNIWPSAWNKIYKKSIIDKNNLRYHENILYEDHTFYYEYLLNCEKVSHLNKPLYIYRHHRNDSIMKDVSPRIFEIFTILGYIENIFRSNANKLNLNDEILYRILVKLSVRLLWERTINFHKKKDKTQKKFIEQSKKFLRKYSKRDILSYKDPFINSFDLFESGKIIEVRKTDTKKIYKICGLKFSISKKRKNFEEIKPIQENIDVKKMRAELNNIKDLCCNLIKDSLSGEKYQLKKNTDLNKIDKINSELEKLKPNFYFIPNPGNLGDVIIAQSEYELLQNYDYKIIDNETSFLPLENKFNLVYGGGGLFVKYWAYQNFLNIFKKQNLQKCIILPSSFYCCDDLINVFDERFVVFCREEISYKYCKSLNNKAKFILADDMAFSINKDINSIAIDRFNENLEKLDQSSILKIHNEIFDKYKSVENNIKLALASRTVINKNNIRIGFIFRNDKEKATTDCPVKNIDLSLYSTSSCTSSGSTKLLSELFISAIDSFDVVFTDRLHVGIIAALLGKHVYLVDNSYKKISGVYYKSMSDWKNVKLINSISDIDIEKEDFKKSANLDIFNRDLTRSDFTSRYLINEKYDNRINNTISLWGGISE